MEVLHFQMLDPIAEDSIHLAEVNQLVIDAINCYGLLILLLLDLILHILLLLRKSTVLGVAFVDTVFSLSAHH